MPRIIAMLAIGLFLGGGIGFVTAAGLGITLDGHEHGEHAQHAQAAAGADMHAHDEVRDIAAGPDAPTLALRIEQDPQSGWNLRLETSNFRFAPENASKGHIAGEGHAHVYVDGLKIARLYGEWFHIDQLTKGSHEIAVSLNANDHRPFAVAGVPLRASTNITVD